MFDVAYTEQRVKLDAQPPLGQRKRKERWKEGGGFKSERSRSKSRLRREEPSVRASWRRRDYFRGKRGRAHSGREKVDRSTATDQHRACWVTCSKKAVRSKGTCPMPLELVP